MVFAIEWCKNYQVYKNIFDSWIFKFWPVSLNKINYSSIFHLFDFLWLIKKIAPYTPPDKGNVCAQYIDLKENQYDIVQNSLPLLQTFSEKNSRKKGIIFSVAYFRHLEKKIQLVLFCAHNILTLACLKKKNILFLSAWNRRRKIAALIISRALIPPRPLYCKLWVGASRLSQLWVVWDRPGDSLL
jgi:hypothetical protein